MANVNVLAEGALQGDTCGPSTFVVYESKIGVPPDEPPWVVLWLRNQGHQGGRTDMADLATIQR